SVFHAESSRGGFIILQDGKLLSVKSIGIVTAALHDCQPTPLLTRAFHHAMREPSDGDQISTQVRNKRRRHAQWNGPGRNLLRVRRGGQPLRRPAPRPTRSGGGG